MKVEQKPASQVIAGAAPYEQLLTLWADSSKNRRKTTVEDYERIFRQFADFVKRKPLPDIARRDLVRFRDHLLSLGQSSTTASHKLSILKTIFYAALDHEILTVNPASALRNPSKPQTKQRVAFSVADLTKIFSSPVYTEGRLPRGGGQEAAYWLPLLALYTGARVEELAQLLATDIQQASGLGYFINISDEAEHAKLKNKSSRRRIPLHPVLVACGFIDYVSSIKRSNFVFPALKANPRGKFAGYFSNWFSNYLREKIGITDRRKVFHSFRHTFKDTCRAVGIEEAVHDALTGHTGISVGRRYGNEHYPLEPLFNAIERYEVVGLDISHLYRRDIQQQFRPAELRIISAFYGIIVAFCTAKRYQNQAVVVGIHDGTQAGIYVDSNTLVFGSIPENKQLLVMAWIEIHREAILASWLSGRLSGDYLKVEPLR